MTVLRPLELVTAPALAARLGVSPSTLGRLIRAGIVRPVGTGVDRYYLPAETALPARPCQRCGADMGRVKADRKWCDACRAARKREAARDAWQRARGAQGEQSRGAGRA